MDRKRLIALLQRSAAGDHEGTPFCPDDHDIAGFVDGTLNDPARKLIERHLPDCQACVSRVGLLTRLLREHAAESHHEASQAVPKDWKHIAPQWAAAASVVLAVAYLAGTSDFLSNTDQASDYQTTRNLDSQIAAPEILAPSTGVIGSRDGWVIRWTEVPGSLYYEVRVVTDVGDLLSKQRVEGTEWTIDHELNLEPGREYFIRVDAYLSDAKAISSQHIPFRLRD